MLESNPADMAVIIIVVFAHLPPVIMATKGANFTHSSEISIVPLVLSSKFKKKYIT
jgi:hypothetical protein